MTIITVKLYTISLLDKDTGIDSTQGHVHHSLCAHANYCYHILTTTFQPCFILAVIDRLRLKSGQYLLRYVDLETTVTPSYN